MRTKWAGLVLTNLTASSPEQRGAEDVHLKHLLEFDNNLTTDNGFAKLINSLQQGASAQHFYGLGAILVLLILGCLLLRYWLPAWVFCRSEMFFRGKTMQAQSAAPVRWWMMQGSVRRKKSNLDKVPEDDLAPWASQPLAREQKEEEDDEATRAAAAAQLPSPFALPASPVAEEDDDDEEAEEEEQEEGRDEEQLAQQAAAAMATAAWPMLPGKQVLQWGSGA